MYLSLQEYIRYGGNISVTAIDYDRLEYAARKKVDVHTFGRVKGMKAVPEAVKRLIFELINATLVSTATANTNPVASFSTDGYSETYVNTHTTEYLGYSSKKERAMIYEYLAGETDDNGIPLLYCGGF